MAIQTYPSAWRTFKLPVGARCLRTLLQWVTLGVIQKSLVAFQDIAAAFRYVDGVSAFGESTRRWYDFGTHLEQFHGQDRWWKVTNGKEETPMPP